RGLLLRLALLRARAACGPPRLGLPGVQLGLRREPHRVRDLALLALDHLAALDAARADLGRAHVPVVLDAHHLDVRLEGTAGHAGLLDADAAQVFRHAAASDRVAESRVLAAHLAGLAHRVPSKAKDSIGAAWGCKREYRQLRAGGRPRRRASSP